MIDPRRFHESVRLFSFRIFSFFSFFGFFFFCFLFRFIKAVRHCRICQLRSSNSSGELRYTSKAFTKISSPFFLSFRFVPLVPLYKIFFLSFLLSDTRFPFPFFILCSTSGIHFVRCFVRKIRKTGRNTNTRGIFPFSFVYSLSRKAAHSRVFPCLSPHSSRLTLFSVYLRDVPRVRSLFATTRTVQLRPCVIKQTTKKTTRVHTSCETRFSPFFLSL